VVWDLEAWQQARFDRTGSGRGARRVPVSYPWPPARCCLCTSAGPAPSPAVASTAAAPAVGRRRGFPHPGQDAQDARAPRAGHRDPVRGPGHGRPDELL